MVGILHKKFLRKYWNNHSVTESVPKRPFLLSCYLETLKNRHFLMGTIWEVLILLDSLLKLCGKSAIF